MIMASGYKYADCAGQSKSSILFVDCEVVCSRIPRKKSDSIRF
jgi:hypothetical protein